jgi:hypothetical protein
VLADYEALLTHEERQHVLSAATPDLRKERLLARVLVRTVLSRWLMLCYPHQALQHF